MSTNSSVGSVEALSVDRDRLGSGRPVPERRHLPHRRDPRRRVGSVVSTSSTAPTRRSVRVAEEGRRRRRIGRARTRPRRHRSRRTASAPSNTCPRRGGRDRAGVVAAAVDRRPLDRRDVGRQLRRRDLHDRRQDVEIELVERLDDRRPVELVERRTFGTPITWQPGADRRPHAGGGVLDRHAVASASTPSRAAAMRYGLGVRLAARARRRRSRSSGTNRAAAGRRSGRRSGATTSSRARTARRRR